VSECYSFPWVKGSQVLNSGVILVVGSHSNVCLPDGSLREVNIPFVTVGAPAAKNFDEPRR